MVMLLKFIGCSLTMLGAGLWIGYARGYRACMRGQLAWLKLHVPGLEDLEP